MALRSHQGWSAVAAAVLAVVLAGGCKGRERGRGAHRRPDAAARAVTDAGARVVAAPAATLPERPEPPPATGPQGGTLRVHLEAEPPHLNPLLDGHQVILRVVSGLVYETLVECRAAAYAPGLADAWERSPDGLRLTLRLRAGARWHDGRPVTATDVQASVEPLLRPTSRHPALRALLADVEAVEGVPDRGVRLRLSRPSGLPLRALCEIPILPAELLRGGSGAVAQLGRQPVGSGPFRFAGWERGRRIRLVRATAGGGPPYLDEIIFEIDTDGARALARTRRGDIDVLPRLLEVHYPDQVAAGALRETLQLYRLTPERDSFLVVNHRHPLLADPSVRRALALLWDRDRLAEEVHRGLARPLGAPFGTVPPLPFDRPAAERLLDRAGHRDTDGDGVRDREGVPLRMTFLLPAGARGVATEARAYAQDLRRAGLLLDLVTVDGAALLGRMRQGEFDLAPMLWEGRRDDDPAALFGPQGELAFTGYRSTALPPLYEQLRRADGPRERAPILQHIAETLAAEQPAIFLYRHDVPALVARRIHGLCGQGDRLDFRAVWLER